MIALSTALAFGVLNIGFALIPGPDMLCIVTNARRLGRRAGLLVCAGLATGSLLHVGLAASGITILLANMPAAFKALQLAGALYLCWLGWQLLVADEGDGNGKAVRSLAHPFVQGLLSNALNPKVALCFLSVLPQFVDPQGGHASSQAVQLGLVSIGAGALVNLPLAVLAGSGKARMAARWGQRMSRLVALALMMLGAWSVWSALAA